MWPNHSATGTLKGVPFLTIFHPMSRTEPFPATTESDCPGCRAAVGTTEARCFLCGKPVPPEARIGPAPIVEEPLRFAFSLASLMLAMTLLAVFFGLWAMSPGLGILFGVLAAPASIRAGMAAARRRARGRPMTGEEKFLAFMGSLGVVAAISLASLTAFILTCFPMGLAVAGTARDPMPWIMLSIVVGLLASGLAMWQTARAMWPRRDEGQG
jgi:hypothetical protein